MKPTPGQPASPRSAADEIPAGAARLNRRDDYFYEELSRTNNELANLQREMARKNDELARAQKDLETLNAALEARVEQRTKDLLEATQEAERANRAKSEFLSRTSHELRTPLNAILGFGQLLQMDARDPVEEENVEQILNAGQHLLTLVDEVLDLSDAETGRISLTLQPAPVGRLVEETLCLIRSLGARLQVEVTVSEPPEPHLQVLADPERLKRVLLNLLSNAVKYNRPGRKVVVRCALAAAAYLPALRLSVQDSGLGISAEDLPRLFTPFDRLGVDRTQSHPAGAGLGLAFAKRMIEAMGGRLGVESVVGEGSTFWIEIPLAESLPAPLAPSGLPTIPSSESADRGNAGPDLQIQTLRKLLYVADDLSTLRLITRMLARRPGIELLSAETDALGLKLAAEERPDFILLDLHHCEQVLAQLRADRRTAAIPVTIISADASPVTRERMRAAGASALVAKPVDVRCLLGVVDQFVGRRSAGAA